jgi:hypothetical protein
MAAAVARPSLAPPPKYDAKFDDLTIFNSFNEELLILCDPPAHLQVPKIDIRSRGGSTQVATPPVIWFKKDVRNYTMSATQICNSVEAELQRSYLPAPYSPCILQSEADIVRSAALWLLHPIVIALQKSFTKQQVGCYAEVTIDDCRCDALIKIGGLVVAVIEYKNRGYIKRAEFEKGRMRDPSYANRGNILDTITRAKKQGYESAMENDAMCLTKQAAAYSTKWKTRFVALFDWDNMFLWHFAGKDFQAKCKPSDLVASDGHAKWAYGTHVEDRRDFRKALLGFIIEGYNDRFGAKFTEPKPPPFEPSRADKDRKRAQSNADRLAGMTPQQRDNANMYRR